MRPVGRFAEGATFVQKREPTIGGWRCWHDPAIEGDELGGKGGPGRSHHRTNHALRHRLRQCAGRGALEPKASSMHHLHRPHVTHGACEEPDPTGETLVVHAGIAASAEMPTPNERGA